MVEEWCGDSGGKLAPAHDRPAVGRRAGRRRGAPQRRPRRARGLLQRDPAAPRPAVDPLGRVGPVPRRLRGHRDGDLHAHRVVVADAGHVGRRAAGGGGHAQLQQRDGVDERLAVQRQARAVPRRSSSPTARARSAGSPTSSSGPTRCGRSTGRGAACATSCPSRRAPTTTARSTAASSATASGSKNIEVCGVDNITFETDYPHTDSTWPETKQVAEKLMEGVARRRRLQAHAGQRHPHAAASTLT